MLKIAEATVSDVPNDVAKFLNIDYMRYWPLFAVFLSGLGFSLQTLMVKILEEHNFAASFQVIFARGLTQCALASIAVHKGYSLAPGEERGLLFGPTNYVRLMLLCRSVIGFGGIAFAFLAVLHLPMADAICLVMLSPLVSSLAAYAFLGEPWRWQEQVAMATSLVGMVFVVKPSFFFGGESLAPIGVFFGLVSACCAGSAYVFVRILGTSAKMPWENVCLAQSFAQIGLALPFLYMFGQSFKLILPAWQFFAVATGAIIGANSQILMTIGMQREKSAASGAMRMSDLLFGFFWQQLFTGDSVSPLSIVGALLIVSSVLMIVFSKEKPSAGATIAQRAAKSTQLASPTYNPVALSDMEYDFDGDEDREVGITFQELPSLTETDDGEFDFVETELADLSAIEESMRSYISENIEDKEKGGEIDAEMEK